MQFEWDANKAAKNLAKHGIDFMQAAAVFLDARRLTLVDARHASELRFNTTGIIQEEIFIICHTDRAGVTRIISARHASRHERKKYYADR